MWKAIQARALIERKWLSHLLEWVVVAKCFLTVFIGLGVVIVPI
jgi:hypothetical protein